MVSPRPRLFNLSLSDLSAQKPNPSSPMAPLIDDCTMPGGGVEEEKIPPLCSTLVLQRPAKLQPLILSLAGAEVLGQNRGSLLNIRNHPPNPFPGPGANPTQPPS